MLTDGQRNKQTKNNLVDIKMKNNKRLNTMKTRFFRLITH